MKKIILISVLILTAIMLICCKHNNNTESFKDCSEPTDDTKDSTFNGETQQLTLEDVKILAKKGKELTWQDFEKYNGIDTGSGLFIRLYEIDENYSLSIGGASPDFQPMYIYLTYIKAPYETIDVRYDDIQSFLDRTANIKKGTKRFTAVVVQNGETNVPAGKSEEGMRINNGKIILSVLDTGNTDFNCDDLYYIKKDGLTGNIPMPRLLKGDIVRVELDEASEVIPFGSVPYEIEKAVSIQRCRETGEIIKPLETLPEDYSIPDAENDSCIIFKDFDIISGKEYFESFLANVKYNSPANIRIAHLYTDYSEELPFIIDIYYNGMDFTVREMENGTERIQAFPYLKRYITEYKDGTAYLKYILTEDDNATYERLQYGLLSSKYGDYIPFREIYTQKGFCIDGEFCDEEEVNKSKPTPERFIDFE